MIDGVLTFLKWIALAALVLAVMVALFAFASIWSQGPGLVDSVHQGLLTSYGLNELASIVDVLKQSQGLGIMIAAMVAFSTAFVSVFVAMMSFRLFKAVTG